MAQRGNAPRQFFGLPMLHDNLTLLTTAPALSSESALGKVLRYPLRLLPPNLVLPIITGRLRGSRWIVGSSLHRCWMGVYEDEKQQLITRSVQPNTVFYDVGANVGFYTLLGSRLVGSGKVFAFEPLLHNLEYLRKHLALNRIQNVEVLELAVADANADALFEVEATGSMGHLSHGGTVKVQTATLDSLLEQGRILPPNYIKMDIEGAELAALRGAQRCIQQYRPQIFLATHGQEIHSQCCRLLESWGFEYQIVELTANGFGELIASFKLAP